MLQNLAMLMFSVHFLFIGVAVSPMSIHRIMISETDTAVQRMFGILHTFRASVWCTMRRLDNTRVPLLACRALTRMAASQLLLAATCFFLPPTMLGAPT